MLTFRFRIHALLAMAVIFATSADAADPNQRHSSRRGSIDARSNEQSARASWQPVRRGNRDGQTSNQKPNQNKDTSTVKLVGHGVPLPPAESIIDPPILSSPGNGALDGQIPMGSHGTPIHGLPSYDGEIIYGDASCDALPPGQCGCDGMGCDGGCDSMSCGGDSCCGCSMCGELASPNAWRPCVTLCVPQDGWINLEYLMWWQDGMDLPPLVTTSVGTGVPATQAGVLGQASTRTLFGGNEVLDDNFDGGRLRFGVWLDKCHTWGLGAEYFAIGSESENFSMNSTGNPTLSRPFFNTETNSEDAQIVAFPGIIGGTVSVNATSELQGGGIHLRHMRNCCEGCSNGLFCGCAGHYCSRTEAIFGYRGLQLTESVGIRESLVTPAGETFEILDQFETRNQFNGFDIGWMNRRTRGFWSLDTSLRLAIGNTRQTVRINGNTEITEPGVTPPVQNFPGGLLTQSPGNIGVFEQDQFSIVPEFGATLGYQLTDRLRATVGYTFIYWSNVVRPGDHINRDVNPNLIPPQVPPISGAIRPDFAFDNDDYWVQGLSFGGEYRW